jgi:pyruvate formate lyase activating enzyme
LNLEGLPQQNSDKVKTEKTALFFESLTTGKVRCVLCPHNCVIAENHRGICGVRENRNGILFSEVYGKISAVHSDPIEKKPLYHFFPGSRILSFGSYGCNLGCIFCQNNSISQINIDLIREFQIFSPESAVDLCLSESNQIGIAFTYNEPTVWYEFMIETAAKSKESGLFTVMITNGFINPKPLELLIPYIDAFNVDLKSFESGFYRKITFSELNPVLENLKYLSENKKHIEITNLLIPDLNDNKIEFEKMAVWIARNLGKETPFHISKYFPNYKLSKQSTSEKILKEFCEIAVRHLDYVYIGNSSSETGQNTYCPKCGELLIERKGYFVKIENISNKNQCNKCNHQINIAI